MVSESKVNSTRPWMILWAVALILKLVIGTFLPFSADEAYYWTWSHDLQWSYFDHPPFVAWLFYLGHPFEHFAQGARIPGIIFGHLTLLIWYKILDAHLTSRQLFYFLMIAVTSPMVGLGSLILTPDLPLLFFWSLSIYFYLRYLKNPSALFALALGLSLGFGFCSKYNIVLFPPLVLAHLYASKLFGRVRWLSALPIVLIGFIIASLPVWIWNFNHNFDSFLFQMRHGLGAAHVSIKWPTQYFFEQLGIIFPVFAYLAYSATRQKKAPLWLSLFAWGPLVFFFLTAFKGRVEANWPAIAYFPIYALATFVILPAKESVSILEPKSRSERASFYSILLWLFLFMVALTEVAFDWMPFEFARAKIVETRVYDPIVPIAESYAPFYASSYQMAAMLTYKIRKPIYRLRDLGRRSYYDYVPESLPVGDTFFIALRQWDQLPDWTKEWTGKDVDVINSEFRLMEFRRKIPAGVSP